MKALHVELLLKRHQFSPIPDSVYAAIIVSPTFMMSEFRLLCKNTYLDLSFMGYICKTSFDEVWHNMSPGDLR